MPRTLPARPNLEHLKRQAKALLKAYAAGDGDAQRLFAQHLPSITHDRTERRAPDRILLAHALFVIAREYGFASWPKLKQQIEAIALEQRALPQTGDRDDGGQRRKAAHRQRIAQIAEHLAELARDRQYDRLFTALKLPARDIVAVRGYLVEHAIYATLIDALLLSVTHTNARIRFWGAQAMDHFADQRCAEPLRRLLDDPVPRVRWAALHSLQCAECKLAPLAAAGDVVATIVDLALHDPSVKVRRVATYELGQVCADPRAVAALEGIRAQATDRAILRNAEQALERHRRVGNY